MQQLLTEHKLAKVLVCGDQDRGRFAAKGQHCLVVDSGVQFRYIYNFVAVGSEPVDNLLVDVLVRDKSQLASFSIG